MEKKWFLGLFFVFGIIALLLGLFYDRVIGVSKSVSDNNLAECNLILDRNSERKVGCGYELTINSNVVKMVVRIGEVEEHGSNFFINVYMHRNGIWKQERVFIGNKNNEKKVGLKKSTSMWVDAGGIDVKNEVISVMDMTDILRENINKEVVIFLRKENVIFFRQYNYKLLTLVLYQ